MDVQRRLVARATWLLGLRERCALCHRRGGRGGRGCASSRRTAEAAEEDALAGGKAAAEEEERFEVAGREARPRGAMREMRGGEG